MVVHHESWPQGTPCWVDFMTPDLTGSSGFYSALLGWDVDEPKEQFGSYCHARIDGDIVAGLLPGMPGLPSAPGWLRYLSVDDVQVSHQKILAAGGAVIVEPTKVSDLGQMAIYAAPDDAAFGTWQSGIQTGFERANEAGAVIWNETMSRDYDAAQNFYSEVFSYTFQEIADENFSYSTMHIGDEIVGSIGEFDQHTPAEVPSFWSVYFGVDGVDLSITKAQELGGTLVRGPMNTPFGRMATLVGPASEFFMINSTDQVQS